MTVEQIRESMNQWWEEKFGKKTDTPKTFSESDAQRIAAEAAAAAVTAAVAPLEARLKVQETQFSERNALLATAESKQRGDAALARVKAKAGAYVPAFDRMGVPQLFAELAKQPATVTIEFGEGAAKVSKHPLEVFTEFMESLPKIVPAGELYGGGGAKPGVAAASNPGAFAVDANSVRLHEAAVQFAEEKGVTYITAMNAVLKKNPDLGKLGSASAGVA